MATKAKRKRSPRKSDAPLGRPPWAGRVGWFSWLSWSGLAVLGVLLVGARAPLDAQNLGLVSLSAVLLGLLLRQGRTVLAALAVGLLVLGLRVETHEVVRWSALVVAPVLLIGLGWDRDVHPFGQRFGARLVGLVVVAGLVKATGEGLGPFGQVWFGLGESWITRLPPGWVAPAAGPPLAVVALLGATILAIPVALLRPSAGARAACWSLVALWAWGHGFPSALEAMLAGWIVAALESAYALAWRDGLTGLSSRRAFDRELTELPASYALAMVDVDHFKKLNDTWGHDVGDQVLEMVAAEIDATRGANAFRYGGEEFSLVFRGRPSEVIVEELERLRERIAHRRFRVRTTRVGRSKSARGRAATTAAVPVTVSIGWAAARPSSDGDPVAVLKAADRALYRAKEAGRNRVVGG